MKCVICNEKITADPFGWEGGHNAMPVEEGQCCGSCNDTVVTPARLEEAGVKFDDFWTQLDNVVKGAE